MTTDKQQEKELAVTLRLITDNFRIFTSEIIDLNNEQFHKEIDDILSTKINRKIAITLPRGHGKSTHLAVAYPLWEIAQNHNLRILLVSNTAEISRTSLSAIKGHIEKNERYQYWAKNIDPKNRGVMPQLRPKHKREENWSADAITVNRTDLQIKDPTVTAVGLFGSILSRRADIIICDDICNQENSLTEEQRAKVTEWVNTTLIPVLVPGGRFIYIGNTWHMDDLMSKMLKDPLFDVRKRLPAILHEASRQDLWEEWANIHLNELLSPEEKKIKANTFYLDRKLEMDAGVEVLWPKRFSYADLYLKRISNPYSFARMYQCDPSIRPNQKFTEADIQKALDKGKDMVMQDEPAANIDIECTASGLDLAISQKDSADDTVLLTLDRVLHGSGNIKAGDYIIRNIERGKFSPEETVDRVRKNYNRIIPVGIRVESNGYQEMMVRDVGEYGIPVTSYKTGGEKNDVDIGVHSLSILLSQGKLIIPNSIHDARTRSLAMQLVNEMRAYPDGHTGDSLMALWFAFSEIRDYTAQKFITPAKTYTPPPEHGTTVEELDREIIAKQEIPRSGYDHATALLHRAQEADRRAREYTTSGQEERDVFNALMRKRMGGY